ncbi:MAG: hypothetical protein WKI04_04660 [Ferruginibacter sp.]
MLFKKKASYKNFYILSDKVIEQNLQKRLDSIAFILEETGFYKEDKIKIIFCHNNRLAGLLNIISLSPTGAGFHHFSGNIYLFNTRIKAFRAENAKVMGDDRKLIEYTYQRFELDDILTHEILHQLHSDSMGLWEYKRKLPPPHWKAEGFAEYYTYIREKRKNENYDFRKRVALYLRYKDQFPLFYYKSQLLYEILAEYQTLSFNEIMRDEITEEKTISKLTQWYNEN